MIPVKANITIYQGSTFRHPFYWYSDVEVVGVVTAVARSYPTVLTVVDHGIPTGTRIPVRILDVGDWIDTSVGLYATRVDDDNISVQVDGSGQDAYTGSAGRIVYNAPMALAAGWDARMQIRASVDDDTVLAEFLSTDGSITLGDDGLIEPTMIDTDTDLLDFATAVYDVEMSEQATGDVTRIAYGKVTLSRQVTRTP